MKTIPKQFVILSLLLLKISVGEVVVLGQGIKITTGGKIGTTGTSSISLTNGNFINDGEFFSSVGNIVIINGSSPVIIGGAMSTSLDNLTINNTGGVTLTGLALSIGGILVCNGNLNTNGKLTLLSSHDRTALIDGTGTGSVLGNVSMERYLPTGFGYKYISSPFISATVNELGDDINIGSAETSFYRYDENRTASGWVNYKVLSNVLTPLAGYAANLGNNTSPVTIDISGIVNNGNISMQLFNHNNTYTKGFNLVGNPYPSPVDWDSPSGWVRTNIDNTVYYFNSSNTDQHGGSYSTYMNGVSSNGIATNIIPSMQGFFIHVTDGAYPVAAELTVSNEARILDKSHAFSKSGNAAEKSLIRLTAGYSDNANSNDPCVVYYDENATWNFDGQLDALKMFNTDANVTNFYVFADDNRGLSINAIPVTGETLVILRLGLKTVKSGEIEIKIKDIQGCYLGKEISLIDKVTGERTNISSSGSFKSVLPAGDYQNRFFLNIGSAITGISENEESNNPLKVYCANGILKAEISISGRTSANLSIYGVSGQELFCQRVYSSGNYDFYPNLKDGIYLIVLIEGGKIITRKVYFHN